MYSSYFDAINSIPGWRVSDSVKYNREGSKSTMELVNQYLANLGEGSSKKQLEYVCFLYTLLYNSIYDWEQLEHKIYEHFLVAPIN